MSILLLLMTGSPAVAFGRTRVRKRGNDFRIDAGGDDPGGAVSARSERTAMQAADGFQQEGGEKVLPVGKRSR